MAQTATGHTIAHLFLITAEKQKMQATTLTDKKALKQQIESLIRQEPRFNTAYKQTGIPTLRLREGGFLQLYHTIVSQQLSVSAANSIWQKLSHGGFTDATSIITAGEDDLRNCGLSKQKIRYVKSLATHNIDYDGLHRQPDESVIETLTAVTGIGRWTAEIYCLFSLNRRDVFAANDLALQVASQQLFDLPERPKERDMRKLAEQWSPYRSAAAYLLWSYYGVIKGREGTNA